MTCKLYDSVSKSSHDCILANKYSFSRGWLTPIKVTYTSSLPSLSLTMPSRFHFPYAPACLRRGGAVEAGNCQVESASGKEIPVSEALEARSDPRHRRVPGITTSLSLLFSGVLCLTGRSLAALLPCLALSAAISAALAPVYALAEVLRWVFLGFFTLSGRRVSSRSSFVTCSANCKKALFVLTSYASKRAFASPVNISCACITCCPRLEIWPDCGYSRAECCREGNL